jgi:hypothetical protein
MESFDNLTGASYSKKWWQSPAAMQAQSILDPLGIFRLIGNHKEEKDARKAGAGYLSSLFGVTVSEGEKEQQGLGTQEGINRAITTAIESYKEVIEGAFFNQGSPDYYKYMPPVTNEARAQFDKISGYENIIKNNVDEITFRKSIITRLENLKTKIDSLTTAQKDALDASSSEIKEFGRISANLVNGDDIANIDNLSKQAQDEITYVHNDLLKGSFGCEQFLSDLSKTDPAFYNKYTGRQQYPFEVLYPYPGSPHPMFLYGSVYYNDQNGTNGGHSLCSYPSACPTLYCQEFIHDVRLSIPATKENGAETDIGFGGSGGNGCGVLGRFEQVFNIY